MIGPKDVEIIGLTESLKTIKNKHETKAEHELAFGCANSQGGLITDFTKYHENAHFSQKMANVA